MIDRVAGAIRFVHPGLGLPAHLIGDGIELVGRPIVLSDAHRGGMNHPSVLHVQSSDLRNVFVVILDELRDDLHWPAAVHLELRTRSVEIRVPKSVGIQIATVFIANAVESIIANTTIYIVVASDKWAGALRLAVVWSEGC